MERDRAVTSLDTTGSELTRRSFLRTGSAAIGAVTLSSGCFSTAESQTPTGGARVKGEQSGTRLPSPSSFVDLLRVPDVVTAYGHFEKALPAGTISFQLRGEHWVGRQVVIESKVVRDAVVLTLAAPSTPIAAVHVRWNADVTSGLEVLGDAWERSYGDLGWRNLIPERVMPWYFATYDGIACHSYGVRTDASALCFWQIDSQGVSLWLNVTNGGNGVELGERHLTMATVVCHHGAEGEEAFASITALCRAMCGRTSRPINPIYGANDWCYSYGRSTAETILRDTQFIVGLSPGGDIRPFSVIDGGWSNGTTAWPNMGKLAEEIKQSSARPGIWIRPLEAPINTERRLLLSDAKFGEKRERARELAYDPTVPEARERIRAKVSEVTGWGYELIKHDFSTYDLLGQWGFEMGPQPTTPGWSLFDRSCTNAEVIAELYSLLREAAGERVLIDGCNTVGHLGQGIFDLQRTGDDTSGRQWERTRRMGVNTIGFRLPQHGTFFTMDPDLVGITEAIPWEFNRQWLDLLARSGAATMVSPGPPARGVEQRAALKEAFQVAASGGLAAKPADWMQTSAPELWRTAGESKAETERHYRWSGMEGASPFLGP